MGDYPDNFPLVDAQQIVTAPWRQWMQRVQNALNAVYGSGPTASRPAKLLWIGRSFFDTDLGHPVWVQSVNPAVWVDATGTAV
jgi:hypothetical protein